MILSAGQKPSTAKSDAGSPLPATAAAPTTTDASPPQASPPTTLRFAAHTIGKAKVGLVDDDVKIPPGRRIELPATTVFDAKGVFSGSKHDPTTWARDRTKVRAKLHRGPATIIGLWPCPVAGADAAIDQNANNHRMLRLRPSKVKTSGRCLSDPHWHGAVTRPMNFSLGSKRKMIPQEKIKRARRDKRTSSGTDFGFKFDCPANFGEGDCIFPSNRQSSDVR